jgi:hypothetical protein
MAETKLSYFWRRPSLAGNIQAAVSLHGHTNRSKESLHFLPKLAQKFPTLHAALEKQRKRSPVPVDFVRAYWTPPLTPKLAYETEREQIENILGMMSLVSLTDHDNIDAPLLLQTMSEDARTPVSVEWSVPFGGTVFHLGVHNLPIGRAQEVMADLAAHTRTPSDKHLNELLAMLHECPDVLLVFNHPFWNQGGVGEQQYGETLNRFLRCSVRFLHAFELNAMRCSKENDAAMKLAERWQRPLISGGDRHGCEPSGALNLTRATNFPEFVREIRQEQRSHVLLMPQYADPLSVRTMRTLLDVIRNYPEFPVGSRRWDERVFHPDDATGMDRPLSTFWKAPPAFVEQILGTIRLLENATLQRVLRRAFRSGLSSAIPSAISSEVAS